MKELQFFEKHRHYDTEIEAAVLGVVLMEGSAMGIVYVLLKPEHFYSNTHQKIYEVMCEMFNQSAPIDILTVREWLINKKAIRHFPEGNVGVVLCRLTNNVASGAHLEYHCGILLEQWQRRAILAARLADIDDFNTNPQADAKSLLNRLEIVLGGKQESDWHHISDLVIKLIQHQHRIAAGKFRHITTGFNKLNRINGGFTEGDLIVVGARPSVGKSALMSEMVLQMAKQGNRVGVVSLEMADIQITARLASIETNTPFMQVFRDMAKDEIEMRNFYHNVSREMVNLPIFISEKTKVSVTEIRAKALSLQRSHGIDVLFIDYLQLIDGKAENKNYNREQEVSQMSRNLKILAKDLKISVVALCQLNREVMNRPYEKRFPRLSDFRESGAIEQDADVVLFLHRDFKSGFEINPDTKESTENEADLVVGKWRNGQECVIELDFDGAKMSFKERVKTNYINTVNVPPQLPRSDYHSDNPF